MSVAFALAYLAAASAPPANAVPAAPAQPAVPAPKPPKEKKVCVSETELGSIMPKRVCRSQTEWQAYTKEITARTIERADNGGYIRPN